jgi:hypothetical protein
MRRSIAKWQTISHAERPSVMAGTPAITRPSGAAHFY